MEQTQEIIKLQAIDINPIGEVDDLLNKKIENVKSEFTERLEKLAAELDEMKKKDSLKVY